MPAPLPRATVTTHSSIRVAASRRWHRTRAWLRGSAIVLTYHRVGDQSGDSHHLTVSEDHFLQQMEVIAHEHATMTAGELAACMRRGAALPRRAVVVTFDDGYAKTHSVASEILGRLGIRATSFVCSDTIGSAEEYWWDAPSANVGGDTLGAGSPGVAARPDRRVMSADELRAFAAGATFEFAAHTRTHPRLASLSPDAQRDEILGGKAALEGLLGNKVISFAYPHGGPDQFDATSIDLAREAGFDAAFTTIPGVVLPWADRFRVPRFHTENIDGNAFRTLLDGWFDAAR